MQIRDVPQEELLAERDRLEALLYAADYRAYELSATRLTAKLLDFPLEVAISYVWTGFWTTADGSRGPSSPNVTIATSAIEDIASLRERIGADRPHVRQTPKIAALSGRAASLERNFILLDTERLVAEFDDGGTAVIILVRSADGLPDRIEIQPLSDIHDMVQEWRSM